ncbi:MAG TPA: N-acetyltransferase [Rhodobiaceae bacterium]|nr:N-acetyltransferase [Rhodobiaceae bacterium]
MHFELLNPKKHDRKSFDCGVEALNLYLQRAANQDSKRSITRVHVMVEGERIIGFFTLSGHSVLRDNLPDGVKISSYKDLPFLLLGRLAVDVEFQGRGYGDLLIYHAFKKTASIAEDAGILGIVVEAKDDKAASFYNGIGFLPLEATPQRMVLTIQTINSLLEQAG